MNIIHLISGGDVGGAKTHVLTLLAGLMQTENVRLVCFTEGEFTHEAREMGIPITIVQGGDPLLCEGGSDHHPGAWGAGGALPRCPCQYDGHAGAGEDPRSRGNHRPQRLSAGLSGQTCGQAYLRHRQYRGPAVFGLLHRCVRPHGGTADLPRL